MYDMTLLDLVRLRREQTERNAERARLVREARPQRRLDRQTQGR